MENPNDPYLTPEERAALNKKNASTGLKVTVLIVLVVLLAVGILLPIKLVPNAMSSIATTLTSIFVPNKTVKITTDKTVINSGENFIISWDGAHKTNGSYSLSYECTNGFHLETSIHQPNETIACNTPFYFSPDTNSINLTAFSEGQRYSDVKITIGFLENNGTNTDTLADKVVTITNPAISDNLATSDSPATTTKPKPTVVTPKPVAVKPTPKPVKKPAPVYYPSTPSYPVSNQYGLPDLVVRPIAVGYVNNNGVFIPSSVVYNNQQAAVKFAIVNVGTKNSGSFTFSADLPSNTDPRYNAGDQQSLAPGERIEYVLSFKNLKNIQNNGATIYVDQPNYVRELSESNNIARMNIVNGNVFGSNNNSGYGNADLSVRILDTGYVNRSSGTYYASGSVSSSDRVGVRFEVVNNGTSATGNWQFTANLPASDYNAVNYTSDNEPSLNPGEKFIFTLNFDNIRNAGYNTVSVTVDSANQVNESSENNNTTSATIYRN